MTLIFRKQPSGGRGEYELIGEAESRTAASLVGRTFRWKTPFGEKDTSITLTNQGGKRRLRIVQPGDTHIHRQAAALALLPYPIRDETRVSDARPILLENRYILDVNVDLVSDANNVAIVEPLSYTARSGPAGDKDHLISIDAPDRFQRLNRIWDNSSSLPRSVRHAIEQHRERVLHDRVIGSLAESAVRTVINALIRIEAPLYVPGSDPLPALEILAGIKTSLVLPSPTEAPVDSPEIRRRLESELRQVRSRGSAGRQFRLDVQQAYGYTCAFCGFRALDIPGLARSGVDAAHILPWGQFDLDHVTNGIQLCKLDHWAFDAHVLLLKFEAGNYVVTLNPVVVPLISDTDTLATLNRAVGVIPTSRLPEARLRPNPVYITKLYEGL